MTQQSLYSMLANEVQEDGGSGNESTEVYGLAKAYRSLVDVLDAERQAAAAPGGVAQAFLAARDELHGAFKQANGAILGDDASGPTIPKPTDPPQPGQFRRPYIADGHAAETAEARNVAVTAPNRPVDASDFTRGPLTDGQERSFSDKLATFHDMLVTAVGADLCRMDAPNPPYGTDDRAFLAPDPSGWFGSTRQPAGSFERPPDINSIPNQAGSLPHPVTLPSSAPSPGEMKGVTPVSYPSEAKMTTISDLEEQIKTLSNKYETLANSGDPAQRADRGTAWFRGKAARLGPSAKESQREAEKAAKRARNVEFYRGMALSGAPEDRVRYIGKLQRLGVDVANLSD
jgi:hypothetical protein